MSKDPAVLFYTSDFLTGTAFFTMEERGKYITLLCLQHQHGSIPENHMISICGSLDSNVVSKFLKDKDGYYNIRMREEAIKRKEFCASRSNNKSGRPKKNKSYDLSYDYHMDNHMENENDNENKDENVIRYKDITLDIILDLNSKAGTNYRATTDTVKKLIKARMNEGFTVEDFKTVHSNMVKAWLHDDKMAKFLRPITLYSNKFESYLNYISNKGTQKHAGIIEWLNEKESQNE